MVVGVVVALNNGKEKDSAKPNVQNEEAKQVLKEAIEVVAADDGSLHANHLYIPWTINKLGNTFFLSQRDGLVVQIDGDFGVVDVQNVETTEDILHEGEGGFLGFTLAADFDKTKRAFAYHTYKKDKQILNRIISLKLENNTWKEEDILVDGIPGGKVNNGGRIQIGPDKMLYATTGDTGNPETAQDQNNLAGKILRVALNGDVPKDNPFENSYVYSLGHRNPQGLVWDDSGKLYSSEHGESGHDEINLIQGGKNYGWPVVQGNETADNMVAPLHHSGDSTWAPSGMAYSDGKLFIASLAGKQIFTYNIENHAVSEFYGEAGRLRDVLIQDDVLFTITNNHDNRGQPTEKDDRLIEISLAGKF